MTLKESAGSPQKGARLYADLTQSVKALPGVDQASVSLFAPMSGKELGINVTVENRSWAYAPRHIYFNAVAPQYFETMQIPILAGRDFGPHDNGASPPVGIINRTLARQLFRSTNPLGKSLRFVEGRRPPLQIIGIVAGSKYNDLREKSIPFLYLCQSQRSSPLISGVLIIRSKADKKAALIAPLRNIIRRLNSSVAATEIKTLREQIDETLHTDWLVSTLCVALSCLALTLTCIGLYGNLSWNLARRNSKIGIRIALGAAPATILALVLREVAVLCGVGLAIGIPSALIASRLVSALLFRLPRYDPITLSLSAALLLSVALLAGYVPAYRASRIDPLATIRSE